MLTSIPTPQPQPAEAFYDISKLNLFTDFSRVTYRAAAGEDAPTGNSTLRPKTWLDTSLASKAPTDQVTYKVIDATGALSSITMSVAEASAVNIAGYHSFPDYVVSPTGATAGGAGLNPGYLSTRDQANQLAAAWGLDSAVAVNEANFGGPFSIVYPPSEIRREFQIAFKGVQCNVGVFIAEQNQNGVGTPGAWDLTGPEPNWISAQPSPQAFVLPPWPAPVRNLLPNEKLVSQQSLFGGGRPLVVRTDMESPYNHLAPPASPTSGGGLTDAQAGQLTAIANGVQSLVGVFKASGAL